MQFWHKKIVVITHVLLSIFYKQQIVLFYASNKYAHYVLQIYIQQGINTFKSITIKDVGIIVLIRITVGLIIRYFFGSTTIDRFVYLLCLATSRT